LSLTQELGKMGRFSMISLMCHCLIIKDGKVANRAGKSEDLPELRQKPSRI
jgi:hypothetical protein